MQSYPNSECEGGCVYVGKCVWINTCVCVLYVCMWKSRREFLKKDEQVRQPAPGGRQTGRVIRRTACGERDKIQGRDSSRRTSAPDDDGGEDEFLYVDDDHE